MPVSSAKSTRETKRSGLGNIVLVSVSEIVQGFIDRTVCVFAFLSFDEAFCEV
jgi:hypothetical protein